MIFKCKMCGGDLDINQEMRICECLYCGSKQTLPKIENDKCKNMFERAGHFRRNNEYDKAMSLYEQIINEDAEDAEVYWSLVLCRYGIEYVEDPVSNKRIPTVNRAQFQSVLEDGDYKLALKYADEQQRAIYEEEAKEIDRIQKGILAISSKEEPFDVFICYKESDASGRRTPDSVLANDLYHQLTQEGFKVFFARITLEDKLGSAYEPYIFAALNSAKVMVVLGTKPEYFNAVWVKNEWSRYLSMIKGGANKVLIPAYKDMDPYDLPEAFAHLQAQDMSKLGFMQDLIRGIKKLTNSEKKTESRTVEVTSVGSGAQALVERAFLFLEDGDFTKADELCEQALNQDPKNALAYVGKLMVEKKVRKQEDISKGTDSISENNYFQKAVRFAEDGLKAELEHYSQMIFENGKDKEYADALELVKQSGTTGGVTAAINMLNQAISKYEGLVGWKDSEAKIAECNATKENLLKSTYEKAQNLQREGEGKNVVLEDAIKKLEDAIVEYKSIAGFTDVNDAVKVCQDKLQPLYQLRNKKLRKKIMPIVVPIVIIVIVIVVVGLQRQEEARYKEIYTQIELAVESGDYDAAVAVAEGTLTRQEIDALFYDMAKEKMEYGEYEEAAEIFGTITWYLDSSDYCSLIRWADLTPVGDGYKITDVNREFLHGEVVIPDGVKEIGEYAFFDTYLTSVTIPSSVQKIGSHAFYESNLTSVTISDGVKEIGDNAFFDTNLTSVTIPGSVQKIGDHAFNSSDLTSVTISDGVKEIGDCAFVNTNLTSVTIPSSVQKIGDHVFASCSSLTDVTMPDDVRLGDNVFENTPLEGQY